MKTASSSDKYQIVAEINMIPFIDITLVLLIIVMVMTPFLVKEQIKINLPATKSAHDPVDSNRLLQVDVTREGAIRVDGTSVTDDGVYEAIRSRLCQAQAPQSRSLPRRCQTQPCEAPSDQAVAERMGLGKALSGGRCRLAIRPREVS